jgi:3-methyladenine DNA glycosylase AlkC
MSFHKQILRATDISMMNYLQKKAAAKDPNTTPEILEQLATDKYWVVRHWVAQNRNTPTKSLELLATDEKSYVRYWVAQHPNKNQIIERLVFMTNYNQFSS